eukprot:Hpha_TRINITY_DN13875_c0_g1::TRINITY_DN13875_c0_g1_i1::g.70114::m.70114/K00799/GST, gst; glutathione S-transferase
MAKSGPSDAEPATDYLSRLMVPELIDGLMVHLVDDRPREPKPFLSALLQETTPPVEGEGAGVELHMARVSMNCLGVLGLLRKAGIAHTIVDVDLMKGEHKKVAFASMNPNMKIPTLKDSPFSVFETNAILRYLCNKYVQARTFYPADLEARARCDMALDWRQTEWYPAIRDVTYPALKFAKGDADRESAASEALTNESSGLFKILTDHFLQGRNFICGAELSIADFAIAPTIAMFASTPHIDVPGGVRSYFERFCNAAGFNEVLDGCGGFGWNQYLHSLS